MFTTNQFNKPVLTTAVMLAISITVTGCELPWEEQNKSDTESINNDKNNKVQPTTPTDPTKMASTQADTTSKTPPTQPNYNSNNDVSWGADNIGNTENKAKKIAHDNNQIQSATPKVAIGEAVSTQPNPIDKTTSNQSKEPSEHKRISTFKPDYSIYAVVPNIDKCEAGALKDNEKAKVLVVVNKVRKHYHLPTVSYNYSDDILTAKASLNNAANGKLTHYPKKSSKCWSQEAATGAERSDLASSTRVYETSESIVYRWVTSLGHRHALLNPFLSEVSFGRVVTEDISVGALKVIGKEYSSVSFPEGFIAHPYKSYPSDWYKPKTPHSFTAIYDFTSMRGNSDVNYDNAVIKVTDTQGNELPVKDIVRDVNKSVKGYGIPNSLLWHMPDMQRGMKYQVSINNVEVNGQVKDYKYWYSVAKYTYKYSQSTNRKLPPAYQKYLSQQAELND